MIGNPFKVIGQHKVILPINETMVYNTQTIEFNVNIMPLVVTRKVTNVNLLILLVEEIYDIVELMVTKKVNALSFLIYGIKISAIVTYDIIHKLLEHNFMFTLAGNDSILTIATEEFLYSIKPHSQISFLKKDNKNPRKCQEILYSCHRI
jgi:hypothetical protein